MNRTLYILDRRERWGPPLAAACAERGWRAKIVTHSRQVEEYGHGFVRVHSHPDMRVRDQLIAADLSEQIPLVQDRDQIELYDDKRGQFRKWGAWMPETWVFEDQTEALNFVCGKGVKFPLISKADVGASSQNVRLIRDEREAVRHVKQAFGAGIPVDYCSSPHVHHGLQKGYIYLQRFIPHKITHRVNIVGRQLAAFHRRCYPDRPMAMTGNTTPALEMTEELESLFAYATSLFEAIGTKWCAADILKDGDSWKLLETSLAWPWPSLFNGCDRCPFWPCGRPWRDMWHVMLAELEDGVVFADYGFGYDASRRA